MKNIELIKQKINEDLINLNISDKINYINNLREIIHFFSPFKNEPIDFVKWIKSDNVHANDYNPNKVAPPEMELLEISIMNDGYTQRVVTFPKEEEILRLCQITGLQDTFKDDDFSKSWESSDSIINYEPLTDDLTEEEVEHYRTINTNDPDRIFHTFEKWECHKAGFYASKFDGMKHEECEKSYAEFLSNDEKFKNGLQGVLDNWINSCEHYLTNKAMNRIAWLGQAAMCYSTGIPSKYCSGFNLLNNDQQNHANKIALDYLNIWMSKYNRKSISMDEALSIGRQVNIY